MITLTYTRPHNPAVLASELESGIPELRPVEGDPIPGVGPVNRSVYQLGSNGDAIAVQIEDDDFARTADVDAIVAAHSNPPIPPRAIEYGGSRPIDAVIRTTDDVFHEVFRIPTKPMHVYRATVRLTAVDAGNGVTKDTEVRMTFKGLAASLAQVGATAVLYNAQDAAASTWAIQAAVQYPDLVISARGALGRSIDWLFTGELGQYAPGGLE